VPQVRHHGKVQGVEMNEKLDRVLGMLTARVDSLDDSMNAVTSAIQLMEKREIEPPDSNDTEWRCISCRTLLGLYDTDADEIRIKIKDVMIHSHVGVGGYLTVHCRRCARVNRLDYEPAQPVG